MAVEIKDLLSSEIGIHIDDLDIPVLKGDKGDKGEKGDKPIVGVDYYTEIEKNEFKNAIVKDSKEDIQKHAANKIEEYDNNATERIKEYNTNASNKINEYDENANKLLNKLLGVETEIKKDIEKKVDKIEGKELSSNDFTDGYKQKLDNLENYDDTQIKKDISNIQKEQTTQNTDISNIKKEQETQNTNIEENNSKIVELQTEKAKLETELKEIQEDFYQNSIRGQASGEYIHVEDSSNCRAKIGIGGNHEQEKRSGKNKYNATINKTVNNVSSIADIQYFILNGTSSTDGRASFRLQTLKAGTYTVNLKYINGSFSNSANYSDHILRIWKGDSWNTFGTTINVNSTDKSQVSMTFTLEEDTEISLGAYYRVNDIYNNIKYAYQIVEGSNSDFDFEPYGAMPSPDYPSEIKTVGSNGFVKVTKCNKNLFDKSKALTGYWITDEQGNIGQAGATAFVTDFIPVFKDVPVYIPATGTSRREFYNKNKVGIQYLNNSNVQIFTPTEDGFIRVSCNMATITMDNLMIFYGETSTSYEQHEEQSYIMPVQQEILQGDYFDWDNEEEVHIFGKKVLTGNENWEAIGTNTSGKYRFQTKVDDIAFNADGDTYLEGICDSYKVGTPNTTYLCQESIATVQNYLIIYNEKVNDTVENFKKCLSNKNVTIYYKLATPKRLKFTNEQKAVAKELNNARTYKNVTNITTDSKAILSLDYAKDLETLLNNTQALAVNNASEGV